MIGLILLMIGALYGSQYGYDGEYTCYFEPDWMGNLWEWNYQTEIQQETFDNAFQYLWDKKIIHQIAPNSKGCPTESSQTNETEATNFL